jgi:maltose/moltooligosaccharide transporter
LKTFFGNIAIYALIIGGFSFILAGLLTLKVEDNDADIEGTTTLS